MNKQQEEAPPASQQQLTPQEKALLLSLEKIIRITQKRRLRIAIWISGIWWLLSWIGIWLEIYHWHHMTPDFRLNPPPAVPGLPPPQPGDFLITVIVSSMTAPPIFLTLVLVAWVRSKSSKKSSKA